MVMKINGTSKMNNVQKIITNNICRICMMPSDSIKAVGNSYELTPKICRMLKICTQLNVEINDSLPKLVCNNCYNHLNEAFKFISLAKKSNKRLKKYSKNMINKSVRSTSNSELSVPDFQVEIKQEEITREQINDKRVTIRSRLNNADICKDTNSVTDDFQTSLTNSPDILLAVGLIQIKSDLKTRTKFKCFEYGQTFLCHESYKRHLSNEHKVFTYECRICGDKFSSRLKLQKHKGDVHSGESPYHCTECKTHFKTLDNLAIHIRRKHVGKSPFICKICKNGFQTKEKLHNHLHIHLKKSVQYKQEKNEPKDLLCKNCDQKFKKNSDLIRHARVHTGEKPFVCKVCKIGFQQAHNLTKHMVIHTKEKAFICDICNKQFGRKDSMMRHMLVHSIQKPYACTKCNKTFARQSQLEVHAKHNNSGDIDIKVE